MALKQNKESPSGPGKDPKDKKIEVGNVFVDPDALPGAKRDDSMPPLPPSPEALGAAQGLHENPIENLEEGISDVREPSYSSSSDNDSSGANKSSKTGGSAASAPNLFAQKGKSEKKANTGAQLQQFLAEVVIEFRKITWPPVSQTIRETWSVLFLVTVITLMVLGFDWFLGHAIFGPLEHFARLHGGGVG